MKAKQIVHGLVDIFKRNKSEIMVGVGVASGLLATGEAVVATLRAQTLIEKKKAELETDKLAPVEVVKTVGFCYIPTIILSTLSVGCVIGGTAMSYRDTAVLSAAYTLSESYLKEYKDYRDRVVEKIGQKKETDIRDAMAQDRVDRNPVKSTEVIVTGRGETLCYESLTGRYFKSDIDTIKRTVYEFNKAMLDDGFICLNDFYYELGLPPVEMGDRLGWRVEDGYFDVRFSSVLSEENVPCLSIEFDVGPTLGYNRY